MPTDLMTILLIVVLILGIAIGGFAIVRKRGDAADPQSVPADPPAAPEPPEQPPPDPSIPLTAIGIPAAIGDPDNLRLIKGIGPKLETLLTGLGITRYDQIAAWGAGEIAKVDAHLGPFEGRIARDNWIEQARLLAAGAIAEYEAKFGKLDGQPG